MKVTFLLVASLAIALVECGVTQSPPSSSPPSLNVTETDATRKLSLPNDLPNWPQNDLSKSPTIYFAYHAQDPKNGTDIGHEEIRQGDVVHQRFFALLPDGRYQITETGDEKNAYKPKISYADSPFHMDNESIHEAGNGNAGNHK